MKRILTALAELAGRARRSGSVSVMSPALAGISKGLEEIAAAATLPDAASRKALTGVAKRTREAQRSGMPGVMARALRWVTPELRRIRDALPKNGRRGSPRTGDRSPTRSRTAPLSPASEDPWRKALGAALYKIIDRSRFIITHASEQEQSAHRGDLYNRFWRFRSHAADKKVETFLREQPLPPTPDAKLDKVAAEVFAAIERSWEAALPDLALRELVQAQEHLHTLEGWFYGWIPIWEASLKRLKKRPPAKKKTEPANNNALRKDIRRDARALGWRPFARLGTNVVPQLARDYGKSERTIRRYLAPSVRGSRRRTSPANT